MRGNIKTTYSNQKKQLSSNAVGKFRKEDKQMTKDEKVAILDSMLKNCPEMLSPIKVSRWTPLGKNRVYALIKAGEIRSFIYQGAYMISKSDLIDYLAEHSEDKGNKNYHIKSEVKENGQKH